jgi:hypothetical protein
MRVIATIVAGALMWLAPLSGCGTAHADASQEKEACQLMDDPAGHDLGYQPAEYAFMVLRETSCLRGHRTSAPIT